MKGSALEEGNCIRTELSKPYLTGSRGWGVCWNWISLQERHAKSRTQNWNLQTRNDVRQELTGAQIKIPNDVCPSSTPILALQPVVKVKHLECQAHSNCTACDHSYSFCISHLWAFAQADSSPWNGWLPSSLKTYPPFKRHSKCCPWNVNSWPFLISLLTTPRSCLLFFSICEGLQQLCTHFDNIHHLLSCRARFSNQWEHRAPAAHTGRDGPACRPGLAVPSAITGWESHRKNSKPRLIYQDLKMLIFSSAKLFLSIPYKDDHYSFVSHFLLIHASIKVVNNIAIAILPQL